MTVNGNMSANKHDKHANKKWIIGIAVGAISIILGFIALSDGNDPPSAVISKNPGPYNANVPITFSGEDSVDNDGTIEMYVWKFGDGKGGSGKTIPHTYSESGIYTVSLKVIDNDGLSHTIPSDVVVGDVLPPSILQAVITTEPGPVNVDNTASYTADDSTVPLGKYIDKHNWYINDEKISNYSYLDHVFEKQGNYQLTLEIYDNEENIAKDTLTVRVLEKIPKPSTPSTPQQPPNTTQNIIPTFSKSFVLQSDNSQSKSSPAGIAMDSHGNVYVTTFNKKVQKFDSNGNFILSFGGSGGNDGQFNNAVGITVDSNDFVYIADSGNNRIQKFDSNGTFILTIEETTLGKFNLPRDVYVDENDHIYVIEYGNNRVQKFDSDGNVLLAFGKQGSGNGEFHRPRSINVDSQGNIYVVDSENFRIQKFDSNGNYILTFGKKGPSYLHVAWPNGIHIGHDDSVYITDIGYPYDQVVKFDSNGNPLFKIGETGNSSGEFRKPRDVVVDNFGVFYVTDGDNYRVQIFRP